MNAAKISIVAVFVALSSGAAFAADSTSEQSRQERMDSAYSDYQRTHSGTSMGTMDHKNHPIKSRLHHAGETIKEDAHKVGHAIGKGVRKTGDAIKRGGEKMEGDSAPKQ